VATTLEILADNFDTGVAPKDIEEVFKRVTELTVGTPVTIDIRNSDQITVKILAKSDHEIKPLAFHKANLSIQLLKDS
jgi:type II secretory pathway component GspD/PulD (secretin)